MKIIMCSEESHNLAETLFFLTGQTNTILLYLNIFHFTNIITAITTTTITRATTKTTATVKTTTTTNKQTKL